MPQRTYIIIIKKKLKIYNKHYKIYKFRKSINFKILKGIKI